MGPDPGPQKKVVLGEQVTPSASRRVPCEILLKCSCVLAGVCPSVLRESNKEMVMKIKDNQQVRQEV